MCAINGFTFKNEDLIRRMDEVTAHRGPDGTRIWSDEHVTLGHNRLAIIDLSLGANQPMKSNDGRLIIVYNGELYNYKELRVELEDEYHFNTQSDTEVILAAYQTWGKECIARFNGIFAFAIWNSPKQELFLARDSMGVKPLFYYFDRERLIFSSEIKAILEHDVDRMLNHEALEHYFRLLYVPEPLTMFKGIWKLPAGHTALYTEGELLIEPYRPITATYTISSVKEGEEKLRTTIDKAVRRQLLTSDRPVGIYLSGGLDSNIVLDAASRVKQRIDTFTVGFDLTEDEEREKFNKDMELAKRSAEHYGTRHHEIRLGTDDVLDYFEKAIAHLGEPISNPTELAMLKLAELAKERVTVTLGGDGGDELFGGYDRYRLSVAADSYQSYVPLAIRSLLTVHPKFNKLNTSPDVSRYELFMFQKDDILQKVLHPQLVGTLTRELFKENHFAQLSGESFTDRFMKVDRATWLRDESLARTDRMSMAYGLEARVPLLDNEVVALADAIPASMKVSSRDQKIILREAFKERLPQHLFGEPKRGWFSPAAKWLRRDQIRIKASAILSPSYYPPMNDLFDWDGISVVFEKHLSKKEYNLTILWALMTFLVWARVYRVRL